MARWKPRMVTGISMVLVITVIMNLMSKSAHHTSFLCFIYLNFQGDDEMTLWALLNKIMKCLLEARRLTFFWYNFMAHRHSWVQFSQMATNTSMGYRVLLPILICSSEGPHEVDSQFSFLFLQMRKLRHRNVEYLAKTPTAAEQCTQTLNSNILFLKSVPKHCAVHPVNK